MFFFIMLRPDITPGYFSIHNVGTDAFMVVDIVINAIFRHRFNYVVYNPFTISVMVQFFFWSSVAVDECPFYLWQSIDNLNDCDLNLLRCLI